MSLRPSTSEQPIAFHIVEDPALPVDACAMRTGDSLLVVFKSGLSSPRRHALSQELLTPQELEQATWCPT